MPREMHELADRNAVQYYLVDMRHPEFFDAFIEGIEIPNKLLTKD